MKLALQEQNVQVPLTTRHSPSFLQEQSYPYSARAMTSTRASSPIVRSIRLFLSYIYPTVISDPQSVIINSMKSQHPTMLSLLVLLGLANGIATMSTDAIANTFVTEIISPFNIPMDDLELAAKSQLSRNDFKTNHFTSHGVEVSKLIYKTTYNSSERIISPKTNSSHHTVTQDSLDLLVTFEAVLHAHLPTKKTYNGTTTLKIYLNYTKGLDTSNGTTEIQNLTMWIDTKSLKMNYSGSPSANDKKMLDEVNNGTSSAKNLTIVYLLQQQQFSSELILSYFTENLVSQKLSPTFNSSYLYQFGSLKATFDMTTAKVADTGDGIAHSLKGTIKGFNSVKDGTDIPSHSSCAGQVSYHTLFTVNFIKNVVSFSLRQNNDWRNFKLDRNRFKSSDFGWRLIDLQYLMSDIPSEYRAYYLNDIRIVCNPLSLQKVGIDEVSDRMSMEMTWGCQGNLLGVTPSPTILDFDLKLLYLIGFSVEHDMLSVLIEQVFLESLEFRKVEGWEATNMKVAKYHARWMISRISGYTVGTNFKVKEGSSKVALKQNEGLWVG